MRQLLAAILILWEPLHFAGEALNVWPTIAYRGALAGVELAAHGLIAMFSAGAGLALWNGAPDGGRLATWAVVSVAARAIQSLYFSVLPNNTFPGTEPLYAGAAAVLAIAGILMIRRVGR